MILRFLMSDSPAMDVIRTIAVVVLSISAFVFVALFGRLPVFRKTPIGFLYRLLMIHIPSALTQLDRRFIGGRITTSIHRSVDYILNEPHPLVLVFFILLQSVSEILFVPPAMPLISKFPHNILFPLAMFFPYYTLYLSHVTSSSVIDTRVDYQNALSAYPYDYILYHPNQPCRTCAFITSKPARSKHCSICKTCIQRQDHHCVWINNCVGRNNYMHFCSLLLAISILIGYATWIGHTMLSSYLQEHFVPSRLTLGSTTSKKWSTDKSWSDFFDAYTLAIANNTRLGAITLLTCLTFPLAAAFLVYHIYILWAGFTTNESNKWSYLKEDIQDGIVWKAKIDEMREEYDAHQRYQQRDHRDRQRGEEGEEGGEGDMDIHDNHRSTNSEEEEEEEEEQLIGRDPRKSKSTWKGPRAEWWVIRTRNGLQPIRKRLFPPVPPPSSVSQNQISFGDQTGQIVSSPPSSFSSPPSSSSSNTNGTEGNKRMEDLVEPDPRWIRVRNMSADVVNIYDLGFWENMIDGFFNRG